MRKTITVYTCSLVLIFVVSLAIDRVYIPAVDNSSLNSDRSPHPSPPTIKKQPTETGEVHDSRDLVSTRQIQPSPTQQIEVEQAKPDRPTRVYVGRPVEDVIRNRPTAPDNWSEFNPDNLTLRLYGETDVSFTRVSYSSTPKHSTWIGRDEATSGWIVATANQGSWHAEVSLPMGNSYRISAGQKVVISEATPKGLICPPPVHTPTRSAAVLLPAIRQSEAPAALTNTDLENLNISTVAVLYDEDTEADALRIIAAAEIGGTAEEFIELNVEASLELANYYLLLSEVTNLEWELAGVGKIPAYQINGDLSMQPDLDAIALTTNSTGVFARQFFTELKADQGMLIVGGEREFDGLGEFNGNHTVVAWYHHEYLSALMAHELGHNFGCNHDRAEENAPDNNGQYAYGHTLTAAGETLGTIMSYGGEYLLTVFSNPDVVYEGEPSGVAADQPKAAYNARQMREKAAAISNFRKHADDPTITQQPQGINATPGQNITISVTATGPNLRYQWYKSTTEPINEATTSTLTLNSVTTGDSGSYFVTVTNERGTTTSNTANVNVRVATPPSSGSSGGGGGGGGAPSLWFALTIVLLFTGRAMCRSV